VASWERFADGDSPVHRLDPRVKVASAVLFSCVVAQIGRVPLLFIALVLPLILLMLARLGFRDVLRRLLVINSFIAILWVFVPFSHPGAAVLTLGPLTATREGLEYALLITLKANTIVMAGVALLSTTPIITLVHALDHLYVPDKLIHLCFFTFRYIHVIHLEYVRLRNAMRVRCFRPRTDLHTYRSFAYLVGMLLLKSYERADMVQKAMLCRGFKNKFWMLHHFRLRTADVLSLAAMTGYSIALVLIQWRTTV